MPNFQQTYRGAISLNNLGIALLERQCHQQALATLRDAMQAMRSVFHHQEGNASLSHKHPCIDILRYTQDAASRFANPLITGQGFSIDIKAVAASDCHTQLPAWRSLRPNILYPIRIDDLSGESSSIEETFEDDIELNVAIVLYNFALATWSCSFADVAKGHPQDVSSVHQMVARLLELPNRILEKLAVECDDEFTLRRIMSINAIVLRCLLHLFLEFGEEPSQRRLREDHQMQRLVSLLQEKLDALRSHIQQIDDVFSHWKTLTSGAPAA